MVDFADRESPHDACKLGWRIIPEVQLASDRVKTCGASKSISGEGAVSLWAQKSLRSNASNRRKWSVLRKSSGHVPVGSCAGYEQQ